MIPGLKAATIIVVKNAPSVYYFHLYKPAHQKGEKRGRNNTKRNFFIGVVSYD